MCLYHEKQFGIYHSLEMMEITMGTVCENVDSFDISVREVELPPFRRQQYGHINTNDLLRL